MIRQKEYLKDFSKDLLEPSAEKLEAMLQPFDLKTDEIAVLPPICRLKEMGPVILAPDKKFDPHIGELRPYVKKITAQSLDHLKVLVGVTNEVIKKNQTQVKQQRSHLQRQEVNLHHLPNQEKFSYEHLKPEERLAVSAMASNLLYGYADKERMLKIPFKGVVNYMLSRSKALDLLFAYDLIVCPGETVVFENFSILFFTNVVVYGSGRIVLGNNTKLHAYQIKHVA